jgi:cobalt/nickel transport system ATP-binding protein
MTGNGRILDIADLSVHYHEGGRALQAVSLALAPGERVALIGPNGAGKTTLLLSVLGGVPHTGKIIVDGITLTRGTATAIRNRCGMMFQDPEDQLFMPDLLGDVAFGPLNQGLSQDEARRRSLAAIEAVGLTGLESRCAHHLSEGQKRSACLATLLAMDVRLLFLDEPGAGLDCRARRRLMDLLLGRKEAMLLATHDLDMVRQMCPRVVLLDEGRVVADGSAEAVLGDYSLLRTHGLMD